MSRRSTRVSEAQWNILLEFIERHPNLVKNRGYNNSARGRAESLRLWEKAAALLNAEYSGTTKNGKEWSIYISNYKSKMKKLVADKNAGVLGEPLREFSDIESKFLAVLGEGFGQPAPVPTTNAIFNAIKLPSIEGEFLQIVESPGNFIPYVDVSEVKEEVNIDSLSVGQPLELHTRQPNNISTPDIQRAADPDAVPPPLKHIRQAHRTRHRSLHLAQLDKARRIVSRVEMQRAVADAAKANALALIGKNIGRLADAAEKYLARGEPR